MLWSYRCIIASSNHQSTDEPLQVGDDSDNGERSDVIHPRSVVNLEKDGENEKVASYERGEGEGRTRGGKGGEGARGVEGGGGGRETRV